MTLERGYILNNRYRIFEILGQGGMAAVYRAIDQNLGVDVAVKENLFTTEEYARQFRREAVILANLRHPNLPRVTDHFVVEQQGQYLVMDYIEGEDLRQRMDRLGILRDEDAILLGAAICDAMTYLHSRKPMVLHRDIKPGNVKIAPNGQIFLVDFGLAKVMQDSLVTTTGARAMTPGYSPPEQYGTAHTDPRSDIYSLGATLYSALTDVLPEDGLARAMEQAELTLIRKRNPTVGRKLAAVIEKSLEVRPDDRYQNAEEFKQALLNSKNSTRRRTELNLEPHPMDEGRLKIDEEAPVSANNGGSVEANPSSAQARGGQGSALPVPVGGSIVEAKFQPLKFRRRRKFDWRPLVLIFMILLAAGIVAFFANPNLPTRTLAWVFPPTKTLTATVVMSRTPVTPVPTTPKPTLAPTKVPPVLNSVTPSLTSTPTMTRTATRTATPYLSPTYTPTPAGGGSGEIAFASDRSGVPEIYLMNLDGSGVKQITTISEGACQPDWNPDGKRLVFISPCPRNQDFYPQSSLFIINADGSNLVNLPTAPGGDYDPAWSPDGKHIAFTTLRQGYPTRIAVFDIETNKVAVLTELDDKEDNFQPVWSPDGKLIMFVGPKNQLWTMRIDGLGRNLLIRGLNFLEFEPDWSPDGQMIVATVKDLNARGLTWLATLPYQLTGAIPLVIARDIPMTEAKFSPDGFWLVFQGNPDGSNHEIFIMTPNGVARQQITTDSSFDFDPDWRPRGE